MKMYRCERMQNLSEISKCFSFSAKSTIYNNIIIPNSFMQNAKRVITQTYEKRIDDAFTFKTFSISFYPFSLKETKLFQRRIESSKIKKSYPRVK